ncbi:MAG: hypothetical protein J7M21_03930, partial [Planctomycetes bacterium]|nr:hypothetical protein [Planctomycetota bacterium]
MAVIETSKYLEPLDEAKARLAGVVTMVLALAATAGSAFGLIWYLTSSTARSEVVAYLSLLTAFAVLGLIGAAQMLRRRSGWQQFLLVYWLAVGLAALIVLLSVLLYRVPAGLARQMGGTAQSLTPWATLAGIVVLALASLAVVLLVMASQPTGRQRYASVAVVSVAAALALVVVVNVLGQYDNPRRGRHNYIHVSMETLGRYGLSERTKKILDSVKEPIRLTCVYTSTDESKRTDELRPRVLELLDDMKIYGHDVTVDNVTTDAGKARLLARLRGQLGSRADKHDAFLKKFQKDVPALLADLQRTGRQWSAYGVDSYLNMWSLPVEIAHLVQQNSRKLDRLHQKIKDALDGPGLPDYAELVRQIKDEVKDFRDGLKKAVGLVADVAEIARAAGDEAKRQVVLAAVKQCSQAAKDMAANVGPPGSADPNDPAKVLTRHVAAARRTAQLATAAAKQLDGLAGADQVDLLRENRYFVVSAGAVDVALSDYYRLVAQLLMRDAGEAEAIVKNAKPDYQKKYIADNRTKVAQTVASIARARAAAEDFVKRLATVDKRSQADMKLAADGKLFAKTLDRFKATLDAIDKLPELKNTSLSTDITGENIVVVEAGGKAEVVGFDEVWPLKVRPMGAASPGEPQKRVFNGDAA